MSKQGYDPAKDECLLTHPFHEDRYNRLTLSIYQYNGGVLKVQISREKRDGDDLKFAKLGRLTYEEMDAVIRAYGEARESLENPKAPEANDATDFSGPITDEDLPW